MYDQAAKCKALNSSNSQIQQNIIPLGLTIDKIYKINIDNDQMQRVHLKYLFQAFTIFPTYYRHQCSRNNNFNSGTCDDWLAPPAREK